MIPRECKRLAEVDFPIAVVSKHAAREKSIRHGHPSTLHLWWARRPLASCRAVLLALLLPDPCDKLCPFDFKRKAREILRPLPGRVGTDDEDLREALLRFIGDFSDWDNASSPTFLEAGRALVKSTCPDDAPLVVDPFAGGGSIPLEALRLGCEAFASDLNPVACLILKSMLEDAPRYGLGLSDALRRAGAGIKTAADRKLSEFYPPDPDGARPIAYLWARTVRCEAPKCGAEIPLVRSFWLSKKIGRLRALRYATAPGKPPHATFETFCPEAERQVPRGTITNAKATCLCCGTTVAPERVRAQLCAQRGGADVTFDDAGERTGGARLIAVVTKSPGGSGRQYRPAVPRDYDAIRHAQTYAAMEIANWEKHKVGFCPIPDELLNPVRPSPNARGLSAVTRYGMSTFGDLYTARQKLALLVYRRLIDAAPVQTEIRDFLGLAFSRWTDIFNALCRWESSKTQVRNLFGRQALPMVWDFAENCVSSEQAGDFAITLATMVEVVDSLSFLRAPAQTAVQDATHSLLPSESAALWFTDPPYYDAIPYADLSDFFFVWLKRILPDNGLLHDPFDGANPLTPKVPECVWNRAYFYNGKPKDGAFFESRIALAFNEGRRILRSDGIGAVVFAHQTTEGWEAFLGGLVSAGWTVTASWPIATELASRIRARENASLATSVHLICRPRTSDRVGDWADVLRELPIRVADWMARLEREGVRGADLVFACIGPALEIFSRYSRVETADGREVPLAEYLERVWEAVGRAALEQVLGTAEARARNGGAGALEEDARLTALFLWTLKSTAGDSEKSQGAYGAGAYGAGVYGGAGGDADSNEDEEEEEEDDDQAGKSRPKGLSLAFDIVRRFAQPLGIHLDAWNGRIIVTEKGVVRLLPVRERAQQLLGTDGAAALADRIEREPHRSNQLDLFPDARDAAAPAIKTRGKRGVTTEPAKRIEATTLDRLHVAMLLQAGGRTNALRALLKAQEERSPDFRRLANALSALYPRESDEKRLLDAMLLAMPR